MKVLIVSHAYVERDNHQKLEILARNKDLILAVIFPKKWRTWHGEEKVESLKLKAEGSYQEFTLDTVFSGDGGKYFYNPIQLIISIIVFRPDLIYIEEEPFSFAGFQLSVISWLLRIKFIFFTWENLDLPLGFIRKQIEKFVFWSAVGGIAGSQEALKRIKYKGFNKKSSVIPQFGVDTTVFKKIIPVKDDPSEVVIGFVGRPTQAKGLDILIKAVSKLTFNYRLLIATSSKEIPDEIVGLAKSLGIEDKIKFETSIPHSDLPLYFNRMEIFVLPSRTTKTWKEQFGRTLVEAMACGVPVVGSSSGAIPEVIGNAGLIFKEEDSHDLSDKLSSLSSEEVRKELSEAGSKRVLVNYTYRILCSNLANFLSH